MAEACANRTHPGGSSPPTTVLKTAGPTRDHPPPSVCGIVPTPAERVKPNADSLHRVPMTWPPVGRGPRQRESTSGVAHRRGDDRGKVAWIQGSDVGRRCASSWQSSCSSRPPSSPTRPGSAEPATRWAPTTTHGLSASTPRRPRASTAMSTTACRHGSLTSSWRSARSRRTSSATRPFRGRAPAEVPNSRCTRCHETLPPTTEAGFSHKVHAEKGTCAVCHSKHRPRCDDCGAAVQPESSTRASRGSRKPVSSPPSTAVRPTSRDIRRSPARAAMTWPRPVAHGAISLSPERSILGRATARSATSRAPSSHSSTRPRPTAPRATRSTTSTSGPRRAHSGRARRAIRLRAAPGSSSHGGSGSDCASCHKPPAKHYAGQCSDCHHKPGSSWKFSHPSAGEHSWKSIPCAACHPKSYTSAYCTCHGGNAPSD